MADVKKIAITTDSSSAMVGADFERLGVKVLPMPFCVDGEIQFENVTLMHDDFYALLKNNADVSTSQPSVGDLMDFWTDVLKEYDEIVHIPLSSGLSKTCDTARIFSKEKEFDGKVQVVDNGRVSIMLKEAVLTAVKLRDEGKSASEIKEYLEKTADNFSCYIAVDTMKYLKKGGRVTPGAAAIGTLLNIKPVLVVGTDKLGKLGIAKGMKKAKETMIATIKADLNGKLKPLYEAGNLALSVAHTNNLEDAKIFAEEVKVAFPDIPFKHIDELSMVISCHTGPGVLAIVACECVK